jgi:cytochrome c oxidase subunit 2
MITGACVAALIIGLTVWACIFFRRGRFEPGHLPRQVRYNLPIELLYTFVPLLIISVLFYYTALRENDQDKGPKPDLSVNVVGFQWSWQFNYLDDGLSVTGRPGQLPTLVLPVNKTVRFYETSPDVIHSFWVIPFLFKRDVVPGRTNSFQVTLTHTGNFRGKCTEFCGTDHDRMLFNVRVVDDATYKSWLQRSKAIAASGANSMFTTYTGPKSVSFGPTGNTQRSHQ